MTTSISIDGGVLKAGRKRAKDLVKQGKRRRYSFSQYVEELIEADATKGILSKATKKGASE